jgi:hypothetical protein
VRSIRNKINPLFFSPNLLIATAAQSAFAHEGLELLLPAIGSTIEI